MQAKHSVVMFDQLTRKWVVLFTGTQSECWQYIEDEGLGIEANVRAG